MECHNDSGWDECGVSYHTHTQRKITVCFDLQKKSFSHFRLPALLVRLLNTFCLFYSLLILTMLNLGLFFKLWAMEDVAQRMYLTTKHRLRERSEARSVDFPLLLCDLRITEDCS